MSKTNDNSQVYYGKSYWNDIPLIFRYLNLLCSGDPNLSWVDDFKRTYAQKPFTHGLFILCGNGWVEREFIDKGIVKKATAFDYSQDLLDQAEAQKLKRDITYFQADVNNMELPTNTYDLIVNVAGLHHVQYLYKFNHQLSRALTQNGVMVSFDYVGPSRNQYSTQHWQLAKHFNQQLPREVRADLRYPDLRTMLYTDPTEAINSGSIFKVHQHFFKILKRSDLGGGLAYLLITHNLKFFRPPQAKIKKYILYLLTLDRRLTKANLVPNLFSYWVSTPKTKSEIDEPSLQQQMIMEKYREPLKEIYFSWISWLYSLRTFKDRVERKVWRS